MPESAVESPVATLTLTRKDAQLIRESLQMMLNNRRFSFKEPQEVSREIHKEVFEAVERYQDWFKANFGAK
jgi:septum formation topological specificity factor MinE